MKRMASICGQACYALASDRVQVYLTVQGGHMTAEFKGKSGTLAPFYTAPWWKEPYMEDTDWIMRLLRGDFFCLPFGSNIELVGGRKYPLHGRTANNCWELVRTEERSGATTLVVRMDLDEPGSEVEKNIRVVDGEPIVYQRHVVRGLSLKSPVAHHPTLQCPETRAHLSSIFRPPLLVSRFPCQWTSPRTRATACSCRTLPSPTGQRYPRCTEVLQM